MRRRRGRPLRAALLTYTATAIAPNAGRGRLFLDSASVDAWRELLPTGLFYGVTTNPTILKRDGVPCTVPDVAKLARTALGAGCQEIMVQAIQQMMQQFIILRGNYGIFSTIKKLCTKR